MIEDTKKMRGGLEEKERCNRKWKKKKEREGAQAQGILSLCSFFMYFLMLTFLQQARGMIFCVVLHASGSVEKLGRGEAHNCCFSQL